MGEHGPAVTASMLRNKNDCKSSRVTRAPGIITRPAIPMCSLPSWPAPCEKIDGGNTKPAKF
jgi:hypothetical protein